MLTFVKVKHILSEILDVDEDQITEETYLVRQLDAESIDLLELALELGSEFNMDIKDDDIFLRNLRIFIEDADKKDMDRFKVLTQKMAHIDGERLKEMLEDLFDGPVLKVVDIVRYIEFKAGEEHGA